MSFKVGKNEDSVINLLNISDSMDELYIKLDEAEQQSINSKEKLKEEIKIIDKIQEKLAKHQLVANNLKNSIIEFNNLKKKIRSIITTEHKKITKRHQETIEKLKETNLKLLEKTKQLEAHVQPVPVIEHQKGLIEHMSKYKSNPWHDLFLFVLEYHPSKDNSQAVKFINNIPSTPVVVDKCKLRCSQWLESKQKKLLDSTNNKYTFLAFAIELKNAIHELNGEPITTIEDIHKMFDIFT